MNFVWITPTYRVNVESIFSLQKESKMENPDYSVWQNTYDEYVETIKRELPPLEIDGEMFDPKNENEATKEKVEKYAAELKNKIDEELGPEPPEYIYKYVIITHTGMKINVSQDKYDLINSIIDKIQKEKEK